MVDDEGGGGEVFGQHKSLVNSTVKAPMTFSTTFSMNKGCQKLVITSRMVEMAEKSLACKG